MIGVFKSSAEVSVSKHFQLKVTYHNYNIGDGQVASNHNRWECWGFLKIIQHPEKS